MMSFALRGNCDGMPLELTGEFTGYNNGPTMQVGLWISNDGERVRAARALAVTGGTDAVADHLIGVMSQAARRAPSSAPALVWAVLMDSERADAGDIDWAQITYDLIGSDPTDEDLAEAREYTAGPELTEYRLWRVAARRRAGRIQAWVMEGRRPEVAFG